MSFAQDNKQPPSRHVHEWPPVRVEFIVLVLLATASIHHVDHSSNLASAHLRLESQEADGGPDSCVRLSEPIQLGEAVNGSVRVPTLRPNEQFGVRSTAYNDCTEPQANLTVGWYLPPSLTRPLAVNTSETVGAGGGWTVRTSLTAPSWLYSVSNLTYIVAVMNQSCEALSCALDTATLVIDVEPPAWMAEAGPLYPACIDIVELEMTNDAVGEATNDSVWSPGETAEIVARATNRCPERGGADEPLSVILTSVDAPVSQWTTIVAPNVSNPWMGQRTWTWHVVAAANGSLLQATSVELALSVQRGDCGTDTSGVCSAIQWTFDVPFNGTAVGGVSSNETGNGSATEGGTGGGQHASNGSVSSNGTGSNTGTGGANGSGVANGSLPEGGGDTVHGNSGDESADRDLLGRVSGGNPVVAAVSAVSLAALLAAFASQESLRWPLVRRWGWVVVAAMSRADRKDAEFTRGMILGYVIANPGAMAGMIADAIDRPASAVAYHLNRLRRSGEVTRERIGGRLHWTASVGPAGPSQADAYRMRLEEPDHMGRRILLLLDEARQSDAATRWPSQGQLATSLDTTQQSVSYHMKLLVKHDLVSQDRVGIRTRYGITKQGDAVLAGGDSASGPQITDRILALDDSIEAALEPMDDSPGAEFE